MCAFKHASNELLRSFNEQMCALNDFSEAHLFQAIKGYEMLVVVAMKGQINELFVYTAGK